MSQGVALPHKKAEGTAKGPKARAGRVADTKNKPLRTKTFG